MEKEILVYADIDGVSRLTGRLWTRARKGKETATFEYDKEWLKSPERFALEPALGLDPGPFHASAGRPLFGVVGDSAPDRWGRMLMRRAERRRAESLSEVPRTLMEIDYLLGVDDGARQGALSSGSGGKGCVTMAAGSCESRGQVSRNRPNGLGL